MNFPIKTNQLKLAIDYDIFDSRYDVFMITTSEPYFKDGARILDAPLLDARVCAVRFLRGKTFYVMMNHETGNLNVLKSVLKNEQHADKITISQVQGKALPLDVVTQLLINCLSTAQSRFLRFNNLTGQLYCFHPQWLKHSKKNGQDFIMKVPCLKIQVTPQLRLKTAVCTFTSVLLRKRISFKKRRFEEYPQYVLSVHNTLRRKMENDTAIGFIQRQTDKDRTEIPFISFQNLEGFEQSKMGLLWQIISDFNTKYDGMAKLDFEEITSYQAIDYTRHAAKEDAYAVQKALKEVSIRLVDAIGESYSYAFCKKIADIFSQRYGLSVSVGKRVAKGHLNVRVIHNKAYYEGENDPHADDFPDTAVQHITLEDFANHSEAAISTIVHELLVKQDLQTGHLSLFDWKALDFHHDWSFGIATENKPRCYFFMTIHPDGSFEIKEQTLNLFEQDKYNNCIAIFEAEKPWDEQIRGVVQDHMGNINIIRDTGWYTIPQIDLIYSQLSAGNTYLRNKNARNELFSACLDIKYISEDTCGYYFVGTIGNGMRASIAQASNIRKIEPHNDAQIFFNQLLPLMNVSFVRNGQLTIVPFPFKYLREYVAKHNIK